VAAAATAAAEEEETMNWLPSSWAGEAAEGALADWLPSSAAEAVVAANEKPEDMVASSWAKKETKICFRNESDEKGSLWCCSFFLQSRE
jgi:hypothetical protein